MDKETIREATIDKVIDDIIALREEAGITQENGGISTDELIIKILDLIAK